jgi:DNA-binding NarL/FixJ family response regulator
MHFLDISMPSYEAKGIYSGEDLAKLILENMPNCKIILLTMFTEFLKIKQLSKILILTGLLLK